MLPYIAYMDPMGSILLWAVAGFSLDRIARTAPGRRWMGDAGCVNLLSECVPEKSSQQNGYQCQTLRITYVLNCFDMFWVNSRSWS